MAEYGNVPEDDIFAMRNAVRVATATVNRLPASVPETWRETAYEILLDGLLSDWVANGTTELTEDDEQDIASLVAVAVDISLSQEPSLRDVTFRALLTNAMHDWIENWNADDAGE